MIAVLAIPAIVLSMLQASITAPTDAFRGCLRTAAEKAKGDKVAGDKIDEYLRTNCTVQMGTLKDALVAFRMKNGMSRKAAADDASMTVDDYLASPADHYKFMADSAAKSSAPASAPAATPASTPAPSPQPKKP